MGAPCANYWESSSLDRSVRRGERQSQLRSCGDMLREATGSGIPHLEAVLHRVRELRWKRVLTIKYLAGSIGIASGLALGREGPTVQMGGAVGAAVAEWMKLSARDRLVLIAAGAGAGLAAAFNAPPR